MKLLITGTQGFIGKNFVLEARKRKIPFLTYDPKGISGYLEPSELCYDGITHAIHLGAISSTTETDIKKVMDSNLTWSVGFFEECVKRNINFHWSSSASVYGKRNIQEGPFRIEDDCKPINAYALSKYLFEQYIVKRNPKIDWHGFRYFNVYGPHEEHKNDQASPYTKFMKQAKETGVINIFEGSDKIYRDFVHVDEIIKSHFEYLYNKYNSGIHNVGTGSIRSFLEVARDIALITGAKINIVPFPENLKQHYQYYTCAG